MSNPYFRFKQFTVHQEKSTMKVCTDSCLFGAWTAAWLLKNKSSVRDILDIGSGTGLLSLILAQQLNDVHIDAVETEENAALQSEENFNSSPWKKRLHIYKTRIQNFHPDLKYDFIICNPPFYENDLQSKNANRNQAHHSTGLTLLNLIKIISTLLSEAGSFALLLPYHRSGEAEQSATEAGYSQHTKMLVKQTQQHSYFRSIMVFTTEKTVCIQDEMAIKNDFNEYTEAFTFLLKEYYLHL